MSFRRCPDEEGIKTCVGKPVVLADLFCKRSIDRVLADAR
jgi:hypothetical protein